MVEQGDIRKRNRKAIYDFQGHMNLYKLLKKGVSRLATICCIMEISYVYANLSQLKDEFLEYNRPYL